MKTKISILHIIFLIIFSYATDNLKCAVKFYQSNQIHKDGSITLNIVYSAKIKDLSGDKMIGNLPFAEDAIQDFFSSPDSKIEKNTVYIDPKDESIIGVNVRVEVKDINKISGIKGLKDIRTSWSKDESGMIFKWNLPVSFMKDNLIDTYQFILTSEDEIKSSNGVKKENSTDWFTFADKIDPKGALYTATIIATEENSKNIASSESNLESGADKTVQENSSMETSNDDSNTENFDEEEKKSCGVFSIELPIIVLLGASASFVLRKRKKR